LTVSRSFCSSSSVQRGTFEPDLRARFFESSVASASTAACPELGCAGTAIGTWVPAAPAAGDGRGGVPAGAAAAGSTAIGVGAAGCAGSSAGAGATPREGWRPP